jgi:mRNA interferase HigB
MRAMQIIALRTLCRFWERHPQAETPIWLWYALASKAIWTGPAEIKAQFGGSVDFVSDNRAIFDIGGNKYRLVVRISYPYKRILIKFIGTHAEYDTIDPTTV